MAGMDPRLRDALIALAVFAVVIAAVVIAGHVARSSDRSPYDKGSAVALRLR